MSTIDELFSHISEEERRKKINNKADCLNLYDVKNYIEQKVSDATLRKYEEHFKKCKECYGALHTFQIHS